MPEQGVKTLDDLADLAGDELVELLGASAIKTETANSIIMAARAHWFPEDETPEIENAAPANSDPAADANQPT